jgi:hypothetical protein
MPVRRRLRDSYTAEDIDNAQVGVKAFELDYGSKYPKAVAKITTWSAGSYRPGRFAEQRSCAGWDALCETLIGQEQSLRPIVESQARHHFVLRRARQPGISRMFGDRCSSQARATDIGVDSNRAATAESAEDGRRCAGRGRWVACSDQQV